MNGPQKHSLLVLLLFVIVFLTFGQLLPSLALGESTKRTVDGGVVAGVIVSVLVVIAVTIGLVYYFCYYKQKLVQVHVMADFETEYIGIHVEDGPLSDSISGKNKVLSVDNKPNNNDESDDEDNPRALGGRTSVFSTNAQTYRNAHSEQQQNSKKFIHNDAEDMSNVISRQPLLRNSSSNVESYSDTSYTPRSSRTRADATSYRPPMYVSTEDRSRARGSAVPSLHDSSRSFVDE